MQVSSGRVGKPTQYKCRFPVAVLLTLAVGSLEAGGFWLKSSLNSLGFLIIRQILLGHLAMLFSRASKPKACRSGRS